jgi:ubiquinone/menaquinone biosynthesis C-methylase UbiE
MMKIRGFATVSAAVILCAGASDRALAQHQPGGTAAPDHMEHRFDNADQWAKSFDDPARDTWQLPDRVIAELHIRPADVVADIGAGTGYFTMRLAKLPAKPKVYAVDIEPSMLEHIDRRAKSSGLTNVVTVKADADRTNIPEPVDVVLIVDTYHHLPNRVAYFTALRKQMKPGARLAIVDFKKGVPDGPPDEFRFTPSQISGELEKAGFSLAQSIDFLPRQHFLVYGTK